MVKVTSVVPTFELLKNFISPLEGSAEFAVRLVLYCMQGAELPEVPDEPEVPDDPEEPSAPPKAMQINVSVSLAVNEPLLFM